MIKGWLWISLESRNHWIFHSYSFDPLEIAKPQLDEPGRLTLNITLIDRNINKAVCSDDPGGLFAGFGGRLNQALEGFHVEKIPAVM